MREVEIYAQMFYIPWQHNRKMSGTNTYLYAKKYIQSRATFCFNTKHLMKVAELLNQRALRSLTSIYFRESWEEITLFLSYSWKIIKTLYPW